MGGIRARAEDARAGNGDAATHARRVELAENELAPDVQRAYLTFVVVGGGPTGVELAGAIADISRTAMSGDFRRIDPSKAHVVLLEAAPRVLTTFSEELSERARRDLTEIGVEVRTNAKVDAIDARGVTIGSERLDSRTVFWAAGVQAERLNITPPLETDRASRIKVSADYSVPGHPNVFVIGDMASLEMAAGQLVPGVAPAAIQAGQHAARMILSDLVGDPRRPFVYNDKGTMATIGKSRAVGQIGRVPLTGRIAWFAWLLIHVYQLIGFRNRLAVLFNWAWNYMFSRRQARLITEKEWKLRN
jgi:NADH dehydrogenase